MKNLTSFINEQSEINEGRPKKDAAFQDTTFKQADGKPADKNGSDGVWGLNEPKDNAPVDSEPIDKTQLDRNMKRLLMKFKSKEDFFIQGEAGWGKTSIIESMAKKFGLDIITVYLDKAVATDIGGIPVPIKGKSGAVQEVALPDWAKIIEDNPDKQFLLFFDEMNQAAPDVMNALMPIVLKHEFRRDVSNVTKDKADKPTHNFFVGAAGNFEHENEGGISGLSGPLKSRFKPIIVWESGTEETWKTAFNFLHKKWDDKIGKKFVDKFEENAMMFENPREIDYKIFKFMDNLKADGDYDYFDAEDYLDRLEGLAKEDLTASQRNKLKQLAEDCYKWITSAEKEAEAEDEKKAKKDINMIDPDLAKRIKNGMQRGYIEQGGRKYGISKENLADVIIDGGDMNAEMVERLFRKFEADGVKWKYETNKEWQDKGYEDPFAE